MKQLHNMQQDSVNWLDARKRVDHQISQANDRLESWHEITYTVDALKKQNAELKVVLGLPVTDFMNTSKHFHSDFCFMSK